ncbi:MAG: GNAT family N-acetyltransferase [Lachnospiraceae bacterium]|nr:GNAT family N-acetyltransferase [Lachnospiraceae bacterium]
MEYREIRKSDDAALAAIIRQNLKASALDIPGTAYFDSHLDHLSDYYLNDRLKRFYYIAVENEEVAGGVGLAEVEFFDDCAELQKLYLADCVKGHGYGYRLIELIEDKARELGYKKIYLETHTNLECAIHMYEKCGYKAVEKPDAVVHATMNRFYLKNL